MFSFHSRSCERVNDIRLRASFVVIGEIDFKVSQHLRRVFEIISKHLLVELFAAATCEYCETFMASVEVFSL